MAFWDLFYIPACCCESYFLKYYIGISIYFLRLRTMKNRKLVLSFVALQDSLLFSAQAQTNNTEKPHYDYHAAC